MAPTEGRVARPERRWAAAAVPPSPQVQRNMLFSLNIRFTLSADTAIISQYESLVHTPQYHVIDRLIKILNKSIL